VSDTKWAKGPWRLIGRYEATPAEWQNMQVVCSEVGADDLYVVAAWTHDIGDDGRDATAHLISAAPELYEALEELLEAVAVIGQAMPPLMYPPACGDRCIKALAALSKAQNADAAKSDARWGALLDVVRERRAKWDADRVKNRAWLDRAFGEAS
jgi:hypothetical protein